MRILTVINRKLELGGEDYSADRIACALNKLHDINRVIFDSHTWRDPTTRPPLWKQPFLIYRNPASLEILKAAQATFKADLWVLHGIVPVGSYAIYPLAEEMGIPVIQYLHNFRPFSVNSYCWANDRVEDAGLRLNFWPEILAGSWQQSRIKTLCLGAAMYLAHKRRLFDTVAHWIAISDFVREKFILAGIPENKITTIQHYYPITRSIPSKPEEEPYYLFLGRLCKEKGLPTLLSAWEILFKKLGGSTPKLIVAGSGPLESAVRSAPSPCVEFVGYIEKETKARLLAHCRSLVVPSTCWEALGMVVHEGYDYCKPVLAAASGGLSETVQNGVTGYLHPPGDAEVLAEQILSIESLTPQQRLSMGIVGHQWLETHATEEQWQKKIAAVFDRALTQFRKSRLTP